MPEEKMPRWHPKMLNQFELYVEMIFLWSLEEHRLDISVSQAGLSLACRGRPRARQPGQPLQPAHA